MPWTGPEFQQRHAHALSPSQSSHAARVANAILRTGGNEGTAIATAIAREKGRAEGGYIPGMDRVGNIDLTKRPVVHNPDGSISTVRSITIGGNGEPAYLIPTVVGGKVVSNDDAVRHFQQTGEHLGRFDTVDNADSYAQQLHEDQARMYVGRKLGGGLVPSYAIGGSTPMKDAQVEYFPNKDWTGRLFSYGRPGNFVGDPTMERKPHGADNMESVYSPDLHTNTDDIPEPLKHGRPTYQYGGEASPALPNVTTSNPIYKGLYQRYAQLSPEQLQEFVLRAGNSTTGQVAQHILQQKRMMPAAVDTTLSSQNPQSTPITGPTGTGSEPPGYALGGGMMSMSEADPWWTRQESRETESGFLHSSVPGRTDHIPASPAADSYVIPADVVSGLADGNSLGGAHILDMAFRTGPYGTQMPRAGGHGSSIPHPRAPSVASQESRGGARLGQGFEKVPIMAAGGEYIVPPHVVRALGRGNRDRGLKLLDKWVVHARKKIVKTMSRLPGPVRN